MHEREGRAYRVLMIAPTSFFSDYGCHVRILEEARFLQSRGHMVAVATYHLGRTPEGLPVFRTFPIPWRTHYEVGSSRHKIAFDVLLFERSARAVLQWRPDIIHAHLHEGALIGLTLAKFFGCPLVCDLQGSLTAEMIDHRFLKPGGTAHRFFYRLERLIDRWAPVIFTSTQQTASLLVSEFACDPERVIYVPDCVNTAFFAPHPRDDAWEARRKALGLSPSQRVVVYLGLLADYQGTRHLIEAAAQVCRRHEDVSFIIAGFPNVDGYKHLAEELGIGTRCIFTGKVPYEEAPNILSLADVAVSPKLSATEGAGKLLNYMAMGLPTVAFDTAVSREYLGDDGVYARAGDAQALADALSALLDDWPRRQALAARLRRRAVEHYTWDHSGERILQAYAEEISQRKRSRA